jgi:hypothetical protein
MVVSCRTIEENAHSEHLRADYKGAFTEWASQVSRSQAITGSPSGSFIMKEAEASVAAAEIDRKAAQWNQSTCKTGTEQESIVAVKEVKPNPARKEQGRSGGANLAYQRKPRRSDPDATHVP